MLALSFRCEKVVWWLVHPDVKAESQPGHGSPSPHCWWRYCRSQRHVCQCFACSLFPCWHLHKVVSSAVEQFCCWGARTWASCGSKDSFLTWHLQWSSRLYFVFYCLRTSNTNSQWHPALSGCINLNHFHCFDLLDLFHWSCRSTKLSIGNAPKKLEQSSGSWPMWRWASWTCFIKIYAQQSAVTADWTEHS